LTYISNWVKKVKKGNKMKPPTKKQRDTNLTELKKNNAIIHIDTTKLTLTHRKAYNILLWNAWDEIKKNKLHMINISDLCHMLGHHDIYKLKIELEKLPSILITWNILRDDGWPIDSGSCGLVAGFRMVGNKFEYSFFEPFREHLKNPDLWTKIKIEIANLFTSSYALALYETCLRFEKTGTGWIKLDDWRDILGIPKTDYYTAPSRINNKIIKPAVIQVNKLSDIKIKPDYHRQGRGGKLTHILFDIEKKENYQFPGRQLELFNDQPIKREQIAQNISQYAPSDAKPVKWLEQKRQTQPHKPKPLIVTFPEEPSEETKKQLKNLRFRYVPEKMAWFGKGLVNDLAFAISAGCDVGFGTENN
jgi:hypothetical protein